MDEKLSRQEGVELAENDMLAEWLGESGYTARLVSQIDETLSLLATKRTTLEEKMINQELHGLIAQYGRIMSAVHERLATRTQPPEEVLEQLRSLNFNVHQEVQRLLKALRYNLNYVEQYFEFDFCARLTNEHRFAAEAQRIADLLKV
jgi:hypothetical protein